MTELTLSPNLMSMTDEEMQKTSGGNFLIAAIVGGFIYDSLNHWDECMDAFSAGLNGEPQP